MDVGIHDVTVAPESIGNPALSSMKFGGISINMHSLCVNLNSNRIPMWQCATCAF